MEPANTDSFIDNTAKQVYDVVYDYSVKNKWLLTEAVDSLVGAIRREHDRHRLDHPTSSLVWSREIVPAVASSDIVDVVKIAPTLAAAGVYLFEKHAGSDGVLNATSPVVKDKIGKLFGARVMAELCAKDPFRFKATVDLGLHHGSSGVELAHDDILLVAKNQDGKKKTVRINCKCISRQRKSLPSYQITVQDYVSAADAYLLVMWKYDSPCAFKTWVDLCDAIDYIALVDSAEFVNYRTAKRFRVNMKSASPENTTVPNSRGGKGKFRTGFQSLYIPGKISLNEGGRAAFEPQLLNFVTTVAKWLGRTV